jgi:uncharacterized delta-60 repeat protein
MKNVSRLLLIVLSLISNNIIAQSGALDNSFGSAGIAVTTFNSTTNLARGIVQQADGKLVIGGQSGLYGFVARYNVDGSIDSSYGTNGATYSPTSLGIVGGYSIAIQPDGKTILAGVNGTTNAYKFIVFRYDTTGAPDLTFGFNGYLLVDFNVGTSGNDNPKSILVKDNNTIYIAGDCANGANQDFAIAKIVNGNLDFTFGTNGMATFDFSSGNDYGTGIAWRGNGNIVVGGKSNNGSDFDFAMLSVDTNGILDNSFGVNGKLRIDYNGVDNFCEDIEVNKSGKILLTGPSDNSQDITVSQFNDDGSIDSLFGTNGVVFTNFNGSDASTCIAIQNDGKIVVAGQSGNGGGNKFMIVRYLSEGALDTSFSVDGIVATFAGLTGSSAYTEDLLIQPDGKLVIAGYKMAGSVYDVTIVRFNNAFAYFNVYPDVLPLNWIVTNESAGTAPMTYLWSWGDGTTSTGATPTHTYSTAGYYNICLTITDANNCTSTYCDSSTYINRNNAVINITVILGSYVGVGLNETFADNKLEIYPNPVSNILTIKNPSKKNLEVFDLMGRRIDISSSLSFIENDAKIDVATFKPGIFLIRNNQRIIRFVKL